MMSATFIGHDQSSVEQSMRVARSKLFCAPAIAALVFVLLASQEAFAWGASGHRMVSQLAIRNLPTEVPRFLRSAKVAETIGEFGREPDRSKGTGNSHDHDLDPGHYVNLSDDFAVGGVLPLAALPSTREDYDSALRAVGTNEYRAGFLPYSIIDGWQQLQRDFAYWRADVAAGRFAKSKQERLWFMRDRQRRELLILRDLGYWSHFVADASQPMHVSTHYDGWGDYPNPQGYSTTKGLHAAFEGAYVARYIRPLDISRRLRPLSPNDTSIQARTLTYLHETQSTLIPFFDAEKAGTFAAGSAAGKAFISDRLAAAVSELRDLIVAAWRTSADSTVGYPPVPVRMIESGAVHPFANMRGLD